MLKFIFPNWETRSTVTYLALVYPWSGKGKCLWHQTRSSPKGPNKMATSCSKSQARPALDGRKVQVQVEKEPAYGDWLRRNQPCSVLLLSPAWVAFLSTEQLHCPRPHDEFTKQASYRTSGPSTRDLCLGKEMYFFLHWAFIIYIFFLLDDIPAINSDWRNLGRWQDNMKKIWGRG